MVQKINQPHPQWTEAKGKLFCNSENNLKLYVEDVGAGFRATYAPIQIRPFLEKALHISATQCQTTYRICDNSMAS